jgi:tRNA G18 (ribose-2'-O)-methylase SpoU
VIPIRDPADPRVEDYLQVRERDLVGRRGLFVAEGEVVLGHLLTSPEVEPVSILLGEARAPRIGALARRLSPTTPVFVAAQEVLDAIAGFHLHRGVLALGRRRRPRSAADLIEATPPEGLVLMLVGVSNHDNLGGLFRNAAAFGVSAVLLDGTCGDPLYRKSIRVSVGAALRTPFAHGGGAADLLDRLAVAGFEILALTPSGEEALADVALRRRTAVVLGTEGPGLPDAVLNRGRRVRIPMAPGFDSLNVATTSGIVLHHLIASQR